MHGWRGKVLRVDLSAGQVTDQPVDEKMARDYIGGRGFGIFTQLAELDPNCDPLGPENILVMASGPLTGTRAPTGARYMVMTKSPLTGAITCSNSGGNFPAMLKKSGIDMIIFSGKAPEPVYLWIDDGRAQLRPAAHLWGKNSHDTESQLRSETHPEACAACIGPAGERGVLFASIMNDGDRAAGRSGVGAVMGAKNLKAVAVHGDSPVPLFDAAEFKEQVKKFNRKFSDGLKGEPPGLRTYGTAATITGTQTVGALPTRNFQQGTFEGWEAISGQALTEKYLVKPKACHACPIGCGRVSRVDEPDFQGEGEGPEYETIYAMGSNCGIDNLAAITKANYICNEQGMDTITMGCTIACAMEMFEKGIITEKDVGMPLKFSDAKALVELTRLTGEKTGFGVSLAEGRGLAYATSPIGASHMRGDPAYIEILGVPFQIDPLTWDDKAQLIKDWQETFAVIDAAGLCVFFSMRNLVIPDRAIRPQGIMELLNAATGAGYTLDEICLAGERIFNAERLFLTRAGFSRKDDTLPERILRQPLPDGPASGMVCHLDEMLGDYYRARGWDATGHPSRDKLNQLGLAEIEKARRK
jgi:aldehyde:ferredoxin oxidoreductase